MRRSRVDCLGDSRLTQFDPSETRNGNAATNLDAFGQSTTPTVAFFAALLLLSGRRRRSVRSHAWLASVVLVVVGVSRPSEVWRGPIPELLRFGVGGASLWLWRRSHLMERTAAQCSARVFVCGILHYPAPGTTRTRRVGVRACETERAASTAVLLFLHHRRRPVTTDE